MEIVLIRHGKPQGACNPSVNAAGYGRWVRHYDRSLVRQDSPPPTQLSQLKRHCLVSSPLPRAVHSCELGAGRHPDFQWPSLREMEIPRYRLPGRLPAYAWLYINRALWIGGKTGPFESFREARQRAEQAADALIQLAREQSHIAVFGHALINRYIAKALCARGWSGAPVFSPYWGDIRLTGHATMAPL